MAVAGPLPALYARWMNTLLGVPIPAERTATCGDCAMVTREGSIEPGFNPNTKCCTYLPELWNFLAGAVLLDSTDGDRGRASVLARIAGREGVRPVGLRQGDDYWTRYAESPPPKFGTDMMLLCPHYIAEGGGLCGIWQHRESTCTTWFCKHDRGKIGQDFWEQLRRVLYTCENALAHWSLRELGVTGDDWGAWQGQEAQFYMECSRLVTPLSWDHVSRIAGDALPVHVSALSRAFDLLRNEAIPLRPMTELVQISPRASGRVKLATYSTNDALDVPEIVASILPFFDGRPTAEALADIERSTGARVDPSLVRRLTDFGVLREIAT
ncbi:MAG TPA: hypothetical protein VEB19_13415 [Gemmatimonadaceae bacterium]|nr:hypothetical protein [Gemmatimonadaceae bacterium]